MVNKAAAEFDEKLAERILKTEMGSIKEIRELQRYLKRSERSGTGILYSLMALGWALGYDDNKWQR